jgi:hypothetical protein
VSKKPKRSPDWDKGFKHLSGVQRYCGNYIASWGSQAIPIDRIWCDVLFLRSVVSLKSVLVLIHNHAVDDAGIIVRTIFEIEFQLGAIKNDRQIAVRLIQSSEGARLKRLKRFRDFKRVSTFRMNRGGGFSTIYKRNHFVDSVGGRGGLFFASRF